MSSVDNRVVQMQFNNSTFERAAQVTLNTLAKLKASLSFGSGKNGLDEVEDSAKRFSMKNVTNQIAESTRKWSAWRTAGLIAFATVVHQAVRAGERVLASFTIDPVKAGFKNYETQINAVQTILANTGLKGAKGMAKVNAVLKELNTYANKTVYNFSEMAQNIGTFTAAGVKLKVATGSIKGIANLAALSGSNSQQASTAMYQLSQAIAANQVKLQDWNSVVNAGLGGKVFQKALFNTGEAMKTIKGVKVGETFDQWTKAGNSFRQSLQNGWITGKVLTTTLEGFTGDMSKAKLVSEGYSKAQAAEILSIGKTAVNAATKIKTFSQLTDALKEEVATAYGAIFKTIFGNINQAKKLFSDIHNVAENALTKPIYALNKLLEGAAELGARTNVIDGFKDAFKALADIIAPIKDAFREIFPPETAKALNSMTVQFKNFMASLKIGASTAAEIKRTFAGVFAILDIGKQAVEALWHMLTSLFKTMFQGSSEVLGVTANLGDFLVALDKSIKKGQVFQNFFAKLGQVLAVPLSIFESVKDAIIGLFDGWNQTDANNIEKAFGRIKDRLDSFTIAGKSFTEFFSNFWQKIQPGVKKIEDVFDNMWQSIVKGFETGNFKQITDALNTGLLAGIALVVRKFFKKGLSVNIGGGVLDSIKEAFEGLTGNLKAMQQNIKADTILKIASAVGILAAAAVALSLVDSDKLTFAMKALAAGFGELLGSMAILGKISGTKGFLKVPIIAAAMDMLSIAILGLVVAVRALAKLNVKELQKGLIAVGVLLGELSASSLVFSRNSAGMIRAGIGMTGIAVALNILYLAVKNFSKLNWTQLGKGLAAVAGSLVGIAAGMRLMPKSLPITAVGLIEVSGALLVIYKAVKLFSSMSWTEMGKGLAGVAGSLTAIGLAMHLMPKGMIAQSIALIAVGAALQLIDKAVAKMGGMSWTQIGKGLATLAGSLLILAVALDAMEGALPGAAALLVASVGLRSIATVLKTLGNLSWESIGKGLVALAGAFIVIGAASIVLAPIAPALLALGAAMILVGTGFALIGAGALGVATALGILAKTGSAGISVLLKALEGAIKLLPSIGTNLAKGLVNFVKTIVQSAPTIIAALGKMLGGLLDEVVKLSPKFEKALIALVAALLGAIRKEFPDIVATGIQMIENLLDGIEKNIGHVTKSAVMIIANFINALANNLDQIIKAGVNLVTKLLVGVASAIGQVPTIVFKVIAAFLGALVKGQAKMFSMGVTFLNKITGGVLSKIGDVATTAAKIVAQLISTLAGWVGKLVKQAVALGTNIVKGIWQGFVNFAGWLWSKISGFFSSIWDKMLGFFGIHSPSTLAMKIGEGIVQGIWAGIKGLAGWLWSKLSGFFSEVWKKISGWITGLAKGIAKGIGGLVTGNYKMKTVGAPGTGTTDNPVPTQPTGGGSGSGNGGSSGSGGGGTTAAAIVAPAVKPVLDLSNVEKDAPKLQALLNPTVSYSSAAVISAAKSAAKTTEETAAKTQAATVIKFEQNNTSPKALSTVEIYRQTKNQLSQAKKVVGLS